MTNILDHFFGNPKNDKNAKNAKNAKNVFFCFDHFLSTFCQLLVHFLDPLFSTFRSHMGVPSTKRVFWGVQNDPFFGHFWPPFWPLFIHFCPFLTPKKWNTKKTRNKTRSKKSETGGPEIELHGPCPKKCPKMTKITRKKMKKTEKNVVYDIVNFQFFQKCHFWTP